MNEHQLRIQNQMLGLKDWLAKEEASCAVLAQYCGPEFTGSIDLEKNQIEDQVEGCLNEGFKVEWKSIDSKIHICVIESWDEPINWDKVSKKESFVDIDRILREAGFEE